MTYVSENRPKSKRVLHQIALWHISSAIRLCENKDHIGHRPVIYEEPNKIQGKKKQEWIYRQLINAGLNCIEGWGILDMLFP